MFSRFTYVIKCVRASRLFMAEKCSIMWRLHMLFIHLLVGVLGVSWSCRAPLWARRQGCTEQTTVSGPRGFQSRRGRARVGWLFFQVGCVGVAGGRDLPRATRSHSQNPRPLVPSPRSAKEAPPLLALTVGCLCQLLSKPQPSESQLGCIND